MLRAIARLERMAFGGSVSWPSQRPVRCHSWPISGDLNGWEGQLMQTVYELVRQMTVVTMESGHINRRGVE